MGREEEALAAGGETTAAAAAAAAAAPFSWLSPPRTDDEPLEISSTNTVGCLHRSRCLSEPAVAMVPRGPTSRSSPWPSALSRISSPPKPPRPREGETLEVEKQTLSAAEGRQRCSRERRE